MKCSALIIPLLLSTLCLTSACGTRLTARGECKYRGYPKGSPGYDACQQQIKAEALAMEKQINENILGLAVIGLGAYGAAQSGTPAIIPAPPQSTKSSSSQPRLCPDGSYVSGSCSLAPNGQYVSGKPTLAPDGSYVGGRPRLTPNGTYVGGTGRITQCPDGSYVTGRCTITPNGTYIGSN